MGNSEFAQKKAKQKLIAQTLSLAIVDEAKKKNKPYLIKQAWNTYHCLRDTTLVDGRLYGRYCKNRFCPICCNIRKANEIKKYKPIIDQWPDPHMVTLTVKSCYKKALKVTVKAMIKAFQDIKDKQRKQTARNDSFQLMGIKSLECNFNPVRRWYNPHFHLIVPDKATADFLLAEWLKRVGRVHAGKASQHIRKVGSTEKDLIEVIKYGFKIFTDANMKKQTAVRNEAKVYARAFVNILDAFHGHRLFDRFGFNLPKTKSDVSTPFVAVDFGKYGYDMKQADWINKETDEVLSEFVPDLDLETILNYGIDKELE
jgi:hypothetical protein